MSNEPEVFRGHLDECIKHLATRLELHLPKGSKGLAKMRAPIATFCGVKEDTVKRWFTQPDFSPTGSQRLTLMCLLDLQGYRVIELERMKRSHRGLCELVGYSLIDIKQASQILGYKHIWDLYAILQGKQGAGAEKEQKMWEMWKERKGELEQRKEDYQKRYRFAWLHKPLVAQTSANQDSVLAGPVAHRTAAINIMQGLLILMGNEAFKNISFRELEILKRAGGETILQLSAQLSTLSSKLLLLQQRGRKGGAGAG